MVNWYRSVRSGVTMGFVAERIGADWAVSLCSAVAAASIVPLPLASAAMDLFARVFRSPGYRVGGGSDEVRRRERRRRIRAADEDGKGTPQVFIASSESVVYLW